MPIFLSVICYLLGLSYSITITTTCGSNHDKQQDSAQVANPSPRPPSVPISTTTTSVEDTEGKVSYFADGGSCYYTIYHDDEEPFVQSLNQCPYGIETLPIGCTNVSMKTYCPPKNHCSWSFPNKNYYFRTYVCDTISCSIGSENGIPKFGCTPTETTVTTLVSEFLCVKTITTSKVVTSYFTDVVTYTDGCPSSSYSEPEESGCTSYEGNVYCPFPNCLFYASSGESGDEEKTVCGTYFCSFIATSNFTGFNCDPSSTTFSNGCEETEFRQWGSHYFLSYCSSSMETTNCGPVLITHDNTPYTFTTCGDLVTSAPPGCKFTSNDIYSDLFLSCNEPCTETFSTNSPPHSTTITFKHCPGQYITPPPTFFTYDPDECTSYNGKLYCPFFCSASTSYQDYYGTFMLITQTYCDSELTCEFFTTEAKPSFICKKSLATWYLSADPTTYWPE